VPAPALSTPASSAPQEASAELETGWNSGASERNRGEALPPGIARSIGGGHTSAGVGITSAFALLVTLAALSAGAGPVHAAQTYPAPPTIEQLARQADVVVVGEVTATAGEWDAAGTTIHTRVHLQPREILKGAASSPLSFTRLGGRVGDRMSIVGGAASFAPGEHVLVFLARHADGSLRLSDLIHGKLRIERDATTGREYATRSTGASGADRFALDQVRAEVRRTLGS
jgi:hypothetical protein